MHSAEGGADGDGVGAGPGAGWGPENAAAPGAAVAWPEDCAAEAEGAGAD
ncbi:hypothetical protein GCM10023224_43520 [Streptomonospora halophila]|uniref:Uncharacterized protein n=1 Tax=Streptomonospora halophila TaxID=427369 RepID=A0ABP9GWQ9_9ACTN